MSEFDITADQRVDSNLFITVSGPSGAGLTTLCEGLSEALDCGHVSGGEVFRDIAEERDETITQLVAAASESGDIDREIDRRLKTIAEKWGAANKAFVLESRLAGWLAGNRADLRIWVDAPEEVRVARTADREEMGAEMRVRDVIDVKRFEGYYDVDLSDRSIYDLVLNTARWSPERTLGIVLDAIRAYDPETDEGAVDVPELDI
ncbi:AAA family ATPase [Natronomonas salina]|uniref:(d)CMP kinase n=1 Tax=Natronomonas salina TaxID=1710540 RepID=UPI0015B78574|nr:AAA family ATPase [Natronomonas salina]QLD90266.1 AAA family ATPase [Natronomonas salina]